MLSHPLKQMSADHAIGVSGDVEGTRNALRPAGTRVHQAHAAPMPSEMNGCSQPGRSSTNHDAVERIPADDCRAEKVGSLNHAESR
jgi:hypothetical protein